MGSFLEKFKNGKNKVSELGDKASNLDAIDKKHNFSNKRLKDKEVNSLTDDFYSGADDLYDDDSKYGLSVQPAQKSESFYQFILDNKFLELEKSVRGYKDVYNKQTEKWEIKRKKLHCFTDEEAEDILRMAQSLLSTDIKLGFINKEFFGMTIMSIYERVRQVFREIAEYKYGRYSHNPDGTEITGGYAIEQSMKLQNLKIFLELMESIRANYSRSISGSENRLTHDSISAQESLQSTDKQDMNKRLS